MRADLATREPEMLKKWNEMRVYDVIQQHRKDATPFILHDGPPYTNSPIHLGTALNKILKDFVVKSRTILGYRSPYIPGFDNHGLPIETAVLTTWMKEVYDSGDWKQYGFDEKPGELALGAALRRNIEELHNRCRAHAENYIKVQTDQFSRLGVFGLWEKPYQTMAFKYEAETIRVFKRLVEADQVYKGLRPVMWSPTIRSALADTEIIYKDYVSKSAYIRFALREDPDKVVTGFTNLHCIIWTTTPWTIPANLACAFHPELLYSVVDAGDAHYLVYAGLVEKTMQMCGITHFREVKTLPGSELENVLFSHPIFDRESRAVLADYVTTEDGTGIVHTAPGHGRDDFLTGMKYNLPVLCPVDQAGVMTDQAGEFEGLYYLKCNDAVLARLTELGNLLHSEEHRHSYPHAERDEKPVIFRTTEQWFVSMDFNDLRQTMIEQMKAVKWHPEQAVNRIQSMVQNRPDWCISRQRPWGVGIPVFYGAKSGTPVLDPEFIEGVAKLVAEYGAVAWYTTPLENLLPAGFVHPLTGETEFVKETDVFDVWFDSGSTHLCVFEGNVEPVWKETLPVDLYLEGSDQHRGWFNTSLILSCACRGEAPYKEVFTHGFVLDETYQKMSKRRGGAIDPVEASNRMGADVLRLWVASVDYANDAPCGENILKQSGETYRTIRNTLRFLLSNLADYKEDYSGPIHELDQWVMEQTELLVAESSASFHEYDFTKVLNGIHNFCTKEVSAFYLDAIKDRMYCDGEHWDSRRSAQKACHYVLCQLVKLVSPILPFTAEEVYERIPVLDRLPTVHAEQISVPGEARLLEIGGNELQSRFATLIAVRAGVFSEFEKYKTESGVKNSQDVSAKIVDSAENIETLDSFGTELANYFKMSAVETSVGDTSVSFQLSEFSECQRSRLKRADVHEVVLDGNQSVMLSNRDAQVVRELGLINA